MSDVAKDIATYLDAQAVATLADDLYYGKLPAEPVQYPVAVVYGTGGFDPEINKNREHFQPTIQVIVTGDKQKYDDAADFIQAIRNALVDDWTTALGDFEYYGCYQQGDTAHIGYDDNDRPQFSANFRLYRRKDNT